MCNFLKKICENRHSIGALRYAPKTPLTPADPVLIFLYIVTTFYKCTILALKRFIVEKDQNSSIFHFKLCSFCWWRTKYYLPPDAGYPSYATERQLSTS